jgi:SAM-dependent methyltransferase
MIKFPTPQSELKVKIVDTHNIQLGDHFNEMIKKYVFVADALNINKKEIEKEFNKGKIKESGYIEGNQRTYYGLVEALWNSKLIKPTMNIVDIGCGYGTTLFNVALQFQNYSKNNGQKLFINNYTGIEKDKEIIKRWKYLRHLWDNFIMSTNIINADLMTCSYSDYDLILSYAPYQESHHLAEMYYKIFIEMKSGALFLERRKFGEDYPKNPLPDVYKKCDMEEVTLLFGGKPQSIFVKK